MSRKFCLFAIALVCLAIIPSSLFAQSASTTGVYTYPSQSYPKPFWWNGEDCDATHFRNNSNIESKVLATWKGIQACGPRPNADNVGDVSVTIPGINRTLLEWQCTELVKRYLYIAFGLVPIQGHGYQIVDNYAAAYPNQLEKFVNDGVSQIFPQEGDVLSYLPNHTAIVTALTVTNPLSGTGIIRIMEQNFTSTGVAEHTINNWVVQPRAGSTVSGWIHPRGWTDISPLNDTNIAHHTLTGITAISPTDIWTVGYQRDLQISTVPSIKHYDGTRWISYNPPGLYGIPHHLHGISANQSGLGFAVGYFQGYNNGYIKYPLAYKWNPSTNRWIGVTADKAVTTKGDNFLLATSIDTNGTAWAAGHYLIYCPTGGGICTQQPYILKWDGEKFARVPIPDTNSYTTITSISAQSSNNVWVAGEETDAINRQNQSLLFHWNGSEWIKDPFKLPNVHLTGIYATASEAWAVGTESGTWKPVILHFTNGTWEKIGTTFIPKFPIEMRLHGVSGSGPDDVWVVGNYYYNSYYSTPYLLHWNGNVWSYYDSKIQNRLTKVTSVAVLPEGKAWIGGNTLSISSSSDSKPLVHQFGR